MSDDWFGDDCAPIAGGSVRGARDGERRRRSVAVARVSLLLARRR